MGPKVGDDDEFLEDVLGEDVSEPRLFDIVRGDIDMVGPEVKVSGRYSPHTPLCLGRKCCPLVIRGCRDDYLISVFVDSTSGGGCDLTLLLRLFLDLCNLLSLLRGSADLHSQDNVSNLRLCQGCHVHTRGWGEGRG